jgi:hydroxyacylglutathione hydrolase
VTVRVVPLPLSISNAYLLLGDRPVLVDAGKPGEEEKLLDLLHQHGIATSDLSLASTGRNTMNAFGKGDAG